jgi:hypothetical protein
MFLALGTVSFPTLCSTKLSHHHAHIRTWTAWGALRPWTAWGSSQLQILISISCVSLHGIILGFFKGDRESLHPWAISQRDFDMEGTYNIVTGMQWNTNKIYHKLINTYNEMRHVDANLSLALSLSLASTGIHISKIESHVYVRLMYIYICIYMHTYLYAYIDIYIYRHISSHSRVMMGMLDVFYSRDQSAPRLCTHQSSVMIMHTPNYST